MSEWLLCYWIRENPLHIWRTIKVTPGTTIEELSARILQCRDQFNSLFRIPTWIDLYKVPDDKPVLEDDSLEDVLGSLSISMLGKPLRSGRAVSSYFASLPRDRLHLIIDPRTLPIQCWIRGADIEHVDRVDMSKSDSLTHLREAIKDKGLTPIDVPVNRLKLYKISAMDDELAESLAETGFGHLLRGTELLQPFFDDTPFSTWPRVVVEWLEEDVSKPPPSAYRDIGSEDPVARARIDFLRLAPQNGSSCAGAPSSFRSRQLDSQQRKFISCGRPRDLTRNCEETIPTTLFHSVFAQFVDDCESIDLTVDDHKFAEELGVTMSGLYVEEGVRATKVNEVFDHYRIHLTISPIKNTKYSLDGYMSTNGHRYVIAEIKNEAGNTSAEPYLEAISYYQDSTRETAPKFPRSPLPCLLLMIFGPYIVFAGATWNLRPTIQILSTPIAFHFHSTDIQNQVTVARHMAAFRKAAQTLRNYYDALREIPLPITPSPPRQIFPHPTSYTSLHDDVAKTGFRYDKVAVEKKLIFFGTEDNGDRICIKFTRTYSRAAHEYLESLGCAPALRGFETIPGGWIMVVMDALPADFETLSARIDRLPASVFADIHAKLSKFHEAGFVHGDFRDVNIMVSKSDESRFMIVDFDWAGWKGVARYPPCVNVQDIMRPLDAIDGKEILAEHDLFMLDRIARLKSRD